LAILEMIAFLAAPDLTICVVAVGMTSYEDRAAGIA
jgi:hypothetical protein